MLWKKVQQSYNKKSGDAENTTTSIQPLSSQLLMIGQKKVKRRDALLLLFSSTQSTEKNNERGDVRGEINFRFLV